MQEIALQAEGHRHLRVGCERALERYPRFAREADVGPYRVVERARGLAAGRAEFEP